MRSSRHRSVRSAVVAVAALMALAGCGAAKDKVVNDALEDGGIELNDLGRSLPDSYPDEVPVPTEGVELESALDAGGDTFVMRFALSDPASATAAYVATLESAGFAVENQFDNLGTDANNVGFTASDGTWEVMASAFGEGDVDGLYMGVTVMAAD